jgi:hypothetical protein
MKCKQSVLSLLAADFLLAMVLPLCAAENKMPAPEAILRLLRDFRLANTAAAATAAVSLVQRRWVTEFTACCPATFSPVAETNPRRCNTLVKEAF